MKTPGQIKSCIVCKSTFTKPQTCSRTNWRERRFCSKRCSNSRVRTAPAEPIPGIVHGLNGYNSHRCRCATCREASRLRKRLHRVRILAPRSRWGHKGETNPGWKGDDVGYKNIHEWVKRHKAKTGVCEHCRANRGTSSGHATHWANIDHAYRRDLDDYIELCPSCHKKYDLEHNRGVRTKH